jgi:glycosyltransferase involved in cell wall biosynthesis
MTSQTGKGVGSTPRVSIVLPAYNSARGLPVAFSELEKQTFRDREIIIVDDGSSDETWETAKALSAGRSDVILERTEHRGPSHARNAGLRLARGDIIFFSESDCVYDPMYLQRAVDCLDSQRDAAAVCLTGAPLVTRATMATSCIEIENKVQHRLLNQGKIEPFYAWVFRRDVLLTLGGFDDRLFQGEDKDLFRRLKDAKYSVAWVPGVNWRHTRDQTTSELASKWFRRGRTRLLYLTKHRRLLEIGRGVAPLWATVLGLILLAWLPLLGSLILLAVVMAFLVRALWVASVSWPVVDKKRAYLGYPLFIFVRNFATGMGYTMSLITVPVRKLQGREVAWDAL